MITEADKLAVYWMGSRNFFVMGSRGDQPIFSTLWDRLVLADSIRVAVLRGHDIPDDVWVRLADYDALIAQRRLRRFRHE